jgi:hypothetical protein
MLQETYRASSKLDLQTLGLESIGRFDVMETQVCHAVD